MTWTRFMDMHSGGGLKEPPLEYIYIEAGEEEAVAMFERKFKRQPDRVTCSCCGQDYTIYEREDLASATEYERKWSETPLLADFLQRKDILVIPAGTP